MDTKLTIDPNVVIQSFKDLKSQDDFTAVWIAAAYSIKNRGKLPTNFTHDRHPQSYDYFKNKVEPILNGKAIPESQLTKEGQTELFELIDKSNYFDDDERRVIKDMLTMWWGRGKYAYTEMIYTQKMCLDRTGVEAEKFIELRKWLKAEECLTWENRPYNDYITSYHTFNEKKLYELLKREVQTSSGYSY